MINYDDLKDVNQSVALVRGTGIDKSGNEIGGHEWIADAILKYGIIVEFWSFKDSENSILECTTSDQTRKYVHFNWGWGGNCNSYFLINILNPNNGFIYDNNSMKSTSNDFSFKQNFRYALFSKE